MNAAEFFLLRYEALHGQMTDRLLAKLTDAQLRARPHGQNSIVWLLWHVARAEDVGVNRFAYDRRQVFDDGGWAERVEAFYGGMTRGWAFAHMALTHSFGHFYEASVVRGMLGFPGI